MRLILQLSRKNLAGRPGRAAAMIALAAFLAFAIFAGSVVSMSLQRGLGTLENRLGADIIVVPASAKSQFNVNDILLQGNPGYFYMDREKLDKIAEREGVAAVSPQLYLASMVASCCSSRLQLIGFDPETDFTILPWVRESYRGEIGLYDILVGANVTVSGDYTLRFYGIDCRIIGQLEKTGSGLDNAVYANWETIEKLIEASEEKNLNKYSVKADSVVSSVLVRVADGYDIEQVLNDINLRVRKVTAVRASNMISGIAENLTRLSGVISLLIAGVWLLGLLIMMIAFSMMTQERKREFAVLRAAGASRRQLGALIFAEALMVCCAGAVLGIALAALIVWPFSTAIGSALGVPFLLPSLPTILALMAATLAACAVAGVLISSISAVRIARQDTGLILREGN